MVRRPQTASPNSRAPATANTTMPAVLAIRASQSKARSATAGRRRMASSMGRQRCGPIAPPAEARAPSPEKRAGIEARQPRLGTDADLQRNAFQRGRESDRRFQGLRVIGHGEPRGGSAAQTLAVGHSPRGYGMGNREGLRAAFRKSKRRGGNSSCDGVRARARTPDSGRAREPAGEWRSPPRCVFALNFDPWTAQRPHRRIEAAAPRDSLRPRTGETGIACAVPWSLLGLTAPIDQSSVPRRPSGDAPPLWPDRSPFPVTRPGPAD